MPNNVNLFLKARSLRSNFDKSKSYGFSFASRMLAHNSGKCLVSYGKSVAKSLDISTPSTMTTPGVRHMHALPNSVVDDWLLVAVSGPWAVKLTTGCC